MQAAGRAPTSPSHGTALSAVDWIARGGRATAAVSGRAEGLGTGESGGKRSATSAVGT